jgi:RNA polymerase sigma-70 factor (ECF subfamily)
MDDRQRDEIDREIRQRFDAADFEGATTYAMRRYGPEICAFLGACHRSADDAGEVFSLFAENLWRALPGFGWQSSFRTWAYAIARRTSLRYRRDAYRRAKRMEPLPESAVSRIAMEVRSETLPFLRSEVKNRITQLRDALPPDDQELLMLRVDRQLPWVDLAQVFRGEDEAPLEGEALKREAARLRKRFQLVKEQLRAIGRREGLLGDTPDER